MGAATIHLFFYFSTRKNDKSKSVLGQFPNVGLTSTHLLVTARSESARLSLSRSLKGRRNTG